MSVWLTATNNPGFGSPPAVSSSLSLHGPSGAEHLTDTSRFEDEDSPRGVISTAALQLTLNQLAVMVSNGIDLAEAIGISAQHCKNPRLAGLLHRSHEGVKQGMRFSATLQAETHFPTRITALIAAAEKTGGMAAALRRGTSLLKTELQLRSTVISSLIYPVILVFASTVVLNALVFFVLPQFSNVFATMGRPVPASTAILLTCGNFARAHWYWFLGAVALLAFPLALLRKHPQVKGTVDWLLIYAPVVGQAFRPLATGRMFTSLGNMLTGGITLLEAAQLTKQSLANTYFRAFLDELESDLLTGNSFAATFSRASFLPPEAAQMAASAERTGRVAEVFTDLGVYYEEEGARQLKRLVHLIEPAVIMVMGILVAGVVLSIMLPLLDLSSAPK